MNCIRPPCKTEKRKGAISLEEHSEEKQYYRMIHWPIPRLIRSMALPTVISMLTTSIYNMADTYFVSQLGTSVSAAVGVAFSLMSLIQMVGFSVGMGASTLISRTLGGKNTEAATSYISSAFAAALVLGLLITAGGLTYLEPLMRLLGSTDTILPHACDYAFYILLSAPLFCASFVINASLRGEGQAVLSMIGLSSGGILNILLDPLLIHVFHLGIAGAAIANMLSQVFSFSIMFGLMQSGYSSLHLRRKAVSPHPGTYLLIIRNGLPTTCRQGIASLASALLNNQAAVFGDAMVAAISIANRIYMFIRSIVIGIGQGFQPVAGFNYGAGRYQRVKSAFWYSVLLGSAICLVSAGLIAWQAPLLMSLFRKDDAAVIKAGALCLRLLCIALPTQAYSTYVNQLLQCLGRTFSASFLASCRQGVFFIPLILYLPTVWNELGIQSTQAIADLLTFLVTIPFQLWFFRSARGLRAQAPAA